MPKNPIMSIKKCCQLAKKKINKKKNIAKAKYYKEYKLINICIFLYIFLVFLYIFLYFFL